MQLNKTKQKLYLDGKVGLINDGTVEQLREVTNDRDYMGRFTYYHKNRIFPSDAPLDNVQYHPIAWFYENETELPKMVKYMGTEYDVVCKQDPYYRLSCGVVKQDDCTPINETNNELPKRVRVDKANEGWYDTEIGNVFNVISEDDGKYFVEHPLNTEYLKHFIHKSDCTPIYILQSGNVATEYDCTPITPPTPTSYKLNIDIPEWVLKAGDDIEPGRLPRSIMEHIATPCITFTLENGTEIELTNNDIYKIKKM